MQITLPYHTEQRAHRAKERALKLIVESGSPHTIKQRLLESLGIVEERVHALHQLLFQHAETCTSSAVKELIARIRQDEQELISLCIHRCDHDDPTNSIAHDLVNNDYSLSLREQLAVASAFKVQTRVVYLHRLQREICQKLKELGWDVSRN